MRLVVIDTSVWARLAQATVAEAVASAVEERSAALTPVVLLELLRSARSAKELAELRAEYDELHHLELSAAVQLRALSVQALLARRGYHRGPSPVDLLTASAAELAGAELWHCDRDFELIAELTRQPLRRLGK